MISNQSENNERMVVIFDGDCVLCNSAANFLDKNIIAKNIELLPSRSGEGRYFIEKFQLQNIFEKSIVFIKNEKTFIKSDAIIELVEFLKTKYKFLKIIKIFPKFIRDSLYDFISNNRHRLNKS